MRNHFRLFAATTAVLALIEVSAGVAKAQNPLDILKRDPAKAKVTLAVDNIPVRQAIMMICDMARAKYKFEANPSGTLTARFTDVPFEQALNSILRSTSASDPLDYRVVDGTYVIIKATPKPLRAAQRRLTLSLKNEDIRVAIARMAKQIGGDARVASDVTGRVTLDIQDEPFEHAMSLLVRTASGPEPLTFMREPPFGFVVVQMSDPRVQSRIPQTSVTVTARNHDIRLALRELFMPLHLNFNIDQSVSGNVSVVINNEPFPKALQKMLDASANHYTWRWEDNVFSILPSKPKAQPSP